LLNLFLTGRSFIYYTAKHNKILAFFVKTRLLLFVFVAFQHCTEDCEQMFFIFISTLFLYCLTIHFHKKKSCSKQDFSFRLFL